MLKKGWHCCVSKKIMVLIQKFVWRYNLDEEEVIDDCLDIPLLSEGAFLGEEKNARSN